MKVIKSQRLLNGKKCIYPEKNKNNVFFKKGIKNILKDFIEII